MFVIIICSLAWSQWKVLRGLPSRVRRLKFSRFVISDPGFLLAPTPGPDYLGMSSTSSQKPCLIEAAKSGCCCHADGFVSSLSFECYVIFIDPLFNPACENCVKLCN